jgi:hypothetical protein
MYTDPGSGLLFVQIIAAAVLSGVYRFRRLLATALGLKRNSNSNH